MRKQQVESRQVCRAKERLAKKQSKRDWRGKLTYPIEAHKGGPFTMLIHRNRKHREDGHDYF